MTARNTPWFSMWNEPRTTVRSLVAQRPRFGIYLLSSVYMLQALFFYANWWSIGLQVNHSLIITLSVLFSPFVAFVWLYFVSYVYYLTGKLLKGSAQPNHLRTCLAWSKVPYSINLFMWIVLIFVSPTYVFIQDSQGPSSVFINLIALIVSVWSFVLLLQSIREVQQFSALKAFFNIVLAWFLAGISYFILFSVIRYFYLLYV